MKIAGLSSLTSALPVRSRKLIFSAGEVHSEADYCFLLDPWWNPATEAQAIDRTHRIGQTRPVMVYRMISRDTIEEKVVALARRKAALFSGVMDQGDLFASGITAEDIRGLLD